MPFPMHPGLHVVAVIKAHGLCAAAAADRLGVRPCDLYRVIEGRGGIAPELAARLAAAFGGSAAAWLAIQADHDHRQLLAYMDRPKHVPRR